MKAFNFVTLKRSRPALHTMCSSFSLICCHLVFYCLYASILLRERTLLYSVLNFCSRGHFLPPTSTKEYSVVLVLQFDFSSVLCSDILPDLPNNLTHQCNYLTLT